MMKDELNSKIYYHLPGLFEFYELYSLFLPFYRDHRDYFYDWCEIGSIYGAPYDCIWGGGRACVGECEVDSVLNLLETYGISGRLTFSNSLLTEEHLKDKRCNRICTVFAGQVPSGDYSYTTGSLHPASSPGMENQIHSADSSHSTRFRHGVIVHSDLLTDYLRTNYPSLYLVSSTTKVLTNFEDLRRELQREEFAYVVPDFRLNKEFDKFSLLKEEEKHKIELLCNECCDVNCQQRKECYENVSRKCLGIPTTDHICKSPNANRGYVFSLAMENSMFIGIDDIQTRYLPLGITNFKIEGRGLGSAVVLEFLLYYLTKPEYQLRVREAIYLDAMLDLF